MRFKNTLLSGLLAVIVAGVIAMGGGAAEGADKPFPAFGSGPVEVRLYTDYFCPPCRALEPLVEPILKEMLKKNQIRLTLVDVPNTPNSPFYARRFLYALKAKHSLEQAFLVRNTLIEASLSEDGKKPDRLEGIFKAKGIPYEVFDLKPLFARYNALLTEDGIDRTPTCVIVKGGQKNKFIGKDDILKAVKALQ
ncbi:MAG: thioredoxin domain-containing protein [Deltaproteobacteria bacterium]|nr:thioredoxin domain-containing protein [Deltaproteobacteria bacterium]